jgi:DNA-binding CsgD family transcriptional regulator
MSVATPGLGMRLPAAPRDAERRQYGRLTARERESATRIARGKTNSEIAAILGPSPRTIEAHVEQILAKLGVENRLAIAPSSAIRWKRAAAVTASAAYAGRAISRFSSRAPSA